MGRLGIHVAAIGARDFSRLQPGILSGLYDLATVLLPRYMSRWNHFDIGHSNIKEGDRRIIKNLTKCRSSAESVTVLVYVAGRSRDPN